MRTVRTSEDSPRTAAIMRLLAFTDSAFPVGTFSFSNTLETAVEEGIVHDAPTLEAFVRDIARQSAYTDGIVALHSMRGYVRGDYASMLEADRSALLCKMNDESRLMTRRMGKKLAELAVRIFPDALLERWLRDIAADIAPGSYPVAQGMAFGACGLSETELFCSQQYGAINMVLGAALRCVRVSHYDTQRILYRLSEESPRIYRSIVSADLSDICSFVPQVDILASLHEQGLKRMFMS